MRPATLLLLALLAPAADAAPNLPPGKYALTFYPRPLSGQRLALLSVADKDGKQKITVADAGPAKLKLQNLVAEGDGVRAVVALEGGTFQLEATLDRASDPPRLVGSFSDDVRVFPAAVERTELDRISGPRDVAVTTPPPEELQEVARLKTAPRALRLKARQADADEKSILLAKAEAADKLARTKVPNLLRAAIDAAPPGGAVAALAAGELVENAADYKLPPAEAEQMAGVVLGYAAGYGPRVSARAGGEVLAALAPRPEYAAVTAKLARAAAEGAKGAPAGDRVRLLSALVAAQGHLREDSAAARAEVAALDAQLDRDYAAKVPGFPVKPFPGRRDPAANRVAVLELFVGCGAPPCAAAEVAAGALADAYGPADLVVLQYHLPAGAPDALANPAGIARIARAAKFFPSDLTRAPAALLNGRPVAPGGGSFAAAAAKYEEYKGAVDSALEGLSPISVRGKAVRNGESLSVEVTVTGAESRPKARLRLALTEEKVRLAAPSGVRFHHRVMRGPVGPGDGVLISELKGGRLTAQLDVGLRRAELRAHLDDVAKSEGMPAGLERPLELKGLRVVALVEDDATGEVLQAAELPAAGE